MTVGDKVRINSPTSVFHNATGIVSSVDPFGLFPVRVKFDRRIESCKGTYFNPDELVKV